MVMFVGSCFASLYGLINCLLSVYWTARENKVKVAYMALKIRVCVFGTACLDLP